MTLRIHVETDDGPKEITEGVQALYDLVVGSMDWGSGFLTVEDAVPIAELAQLCGFKGVREAQRYLVEKRREARYVELKQAGVPGKEAMDQAQDEIGCSARFVHRSKYGKPRQLRCDLLEEHEGRHFCRPFEWSDGDLEPTGIGWERAA